MTSDNTDSGNELTAFMDMFKERLRQEIKPFMDEVRILINNYNNFVEQLPDIVDYIKELYKEFIKLDRDLEEIYPIFIEAKMWVTLNMIKDVEFIYGLREIKENKHLTSQNLIDFIVERSKFNEYKMIKDMIDIWKKDPIFLERANIIKDAFFAHENGMYNLSIPILLAQCEGIASKITGINARKGHIAILKIIKEPTFFIRNASRTALISFIEEFLYKGINFDDYHNQLAIRNIDPNDFLNRHSIIHGVNIDFASEVNSLRMFMLLDSISNIRYVEEIDR